MLDLEMTNGPAAALARPNWEAATMPIMRQIAERETRPGYYQARAEEERQAARNAADVPARSSHLQLALLYRRLSQAIAKRAHAIQHRERAIDQALRDSFPASDPPAFAG